MNASKLLGILTLPSLLLFSAPSQAEIVKYNFTALGYDLVYGPGCMRFGCPPLSQYGDHHLGTVLKPTSTIAGSFFYDTDLKSPYHYEANGVSHDSYADFNGIGSSFTSDTGYHYANNSTRENSKPEVSVYNEKISANSSWDSVTITTSREDSYGDDQQLSLEFKSKVGNGLLSDSNLPTTLSLDNFTGKVSLFWANGSGVYQFFYADITSLTPATPVPEPATYAMMGIGLLCLAGFRRGWQRSQSA